MSTSFPRGSEWRKWDLHIHSPLSILSNRYPKIGTEPDWETFITKLETLDIAVLGITDYFTIEGYIKLLEYRKAGRLQNICTILPNIEFRLDNIVVREKEGGSPQRLNFHVIFSDEVDPSDIQDHFLHELYFTSECYPQDRDFREKLKRSNLELLGQRLKEENESFEGKSPLIVGAETATVRHDDITSVLNNTERFRDKYVLVLDEEGVDLIQWGRQDHQLRRVLMQKADMLFTSNRNTIQWCLGRPPYQEGPDKFLEEFKSLKPCIHGSDAHSIEGIAHPCAKRGDPLHDCATQLDACDLRYCWIKADPTFEGFRQLLYEPMERVVIQAHDPTPPRSNFTIRRIHLSHSRINEELTVDETDLLVHPGFVAITGGRGNGKTALVDLIANCFEDRVHTDDRNSFVRRISDEAQDLRVTIDFQNAEAFTKLVTEDKFIETNEISYISQGELEEYIGEGSDLVERINELVFESPSVKNSLVRYEFGQLGEKVSDLTEQLQSQSAAIIDLEKQTSPKVQDALALRIKELRSQLDDLSRKVDQLEAASSPEAVEQAQILQQETSNLKSRRDKLTRLRKLLEKTRRFVDGDLVEFKIDIDSANQLLSELDLPQRLPEIEYGVDGISNASASVDQAINRVILQIESAEKGLAGHEQQVQRHTRLLEKRSDLEVELEGSSEELKVLEDRRVALVDMTNKRRQVHIKLLSTLLEQKAKYEQIIEQFSSEKHEVLSDLDFHAEIRFDEKRFLDAAKEIFDHRRVNIGNEADSDFASILKLCFEFTQGREGIVEDFSGEIEQLASSDLREKIKPSYSIDMSDFYRFLYSCYFSVVPVVKYKKTNLNRLSLGQKATVLIKIYLAQGEKPIIIDSHDDHLDNQFIMDELIGSIRQAKRFRQILLVSNNGNVVINADAEQIVVAEREDTAIAFVSGSLETSIIREKALAVLEGGKKAFRKRQQKYRIDR